MSRAIFLRHPFLQHLADEHQAILKILESFESAVAPDEILNYAKQLQFLVGICHHRKEEEILFPALEATGQLPLGGPQCTQFMGLRLVDNRAEAIGRLKFRFPREYARSDFVKHAFETQSPLTIPLEEHEAGAQCLHEIIANLENQPAVEGSGTRDFVSDLIVKYLSLLRLHIRKEDECLFRLAETLLEVDGELVRLNLAIEIERGLATYMHRLF